jgi:hypothetical protein
LSQALSAATIAPMALIEGIREMDQSTIRRISVQELREAIASCLILGVTVAGRPIHVQCSYPPRSLVRIITVYEPEPDQWLDYKQRRT